MQRAIVLATVLAVTGCASRPFRAHVHTPGPSGRAPVFELTALGVLGGDWDDNLSAWMLSRTESSGGSSTVLIDGGSLMTGLARRLELEGTLSTDASWSTRVRAVLPVLRRVEGVLLTHAHLDHVGGFIDKSTLDITLANEGRPTLEVMGLPETIDAVRTLGFAPPLWADTASIPATNPSLRFTPFAPETERMVAGFRVHTTLLAHPVPSAAFTFTVGDAVYAHLGDTGPTEMIWNELAPMVQSQQLRALSVEVSFPSNTERLARATGHLTPTLLLSQLARLALTREEISTDAPTRRGQIERIAQGLHGLPIIALHIKALHYDEVVTELNELRAAGLSIVIPEQGHVYRY